MIRGDFQNKGGGVGAPPGQERTPGQIFPRMAQCGEDVGYGVDIGGRQSAVPRPAQVSSNERAYLLACQHLELDLERKRLRREGRSTAGLLVGLFMRLASFVRTSY